MPLSDEMQKKKEGGIDLEGHVQQTRKPIVLTIEKNQIIYFCVLFHIK